MKYYTAITSFVASGMHVTQGDTVAEGHPLLRDRSSLFVEFTPTFAYTPPAQPEVARRAAAPRVVRPRTASRPKPKA